MKHSSTPVNQPGMRAQKEGTRCTQGLVLSGRQWILVIMSLCLTMWVIPIGWQGLETFDPEESYRIPYAASRDYWLYERYVNQPHDEPTVYFVGDSVVWGEYVSKEGTWTHWLNDHSQGEPRFVNLALNGLYPLALEGLLEHYAKELHHAQVLLHCNLLWMSSPQADLSDPKEQVFNHPMLVPQWEPQLPSYHATMETRLSRLVGNHWSWLAWIRHLQIHYWDQKDPYQWTLMDDGRYPPTYPNHRSFPWQAIDWQLEQEPSPDPDRGLESPRHKPWSELGEGTQRYDWVPLSQSLQWAAFQRICQRMAHRDNALMVIIGPFNQHMLHPDHRPTFKAYEQEIIQWFRDQGIAHLAPPTLPSHQYGDASHPLQPGYRMLAQQLWEAPDFQQWIKPLKR